MNEADGQLRAAHLILGYTPLSFAFQAPKYVIKARDPWLYRISVAYQGFIILEDVPLPKDTSRTQPLFVATPSVGASSSQLVLKEEEERREEEEEKEEEEEERNPEEVVDLSDSSDEFEVFNQTLSLEDVFDEMGVQRKPQRSLMELIENQPGKGVPGKSTQSQILPPLLKSPPPAPQPPQSIRPEPADPKRKREQKRKEVIETGRSRSTCEEEAQ